MDGFDPRHAGAFLGYLRTILVNKLKDEIRRGRRQDSILEREAPLPAVAHSPLEDTIGADVLDRYESALQGLTPEQAEAFVMRIELGASYTEIAEAMGKTTPNAARMLVTRAIVALAHTLHGDVEER